MKVYIGEYTEQDLRQGNDVTAIAEAKDKEELKRNGIQYIQFECNKSKKTMKIWLTDNW